MWTKIPGGGGRERLMIIPRIIFIISDYTSVTLHCHHQNDSCIRTGSDAESHFNVSFIVRDQVT